MSKCFFIFNLKKSQCFLSAYCVSELGAGSSSCYPALWKSIDSSTMCSLHCLSLDIWQCPGRDLETHAHLDAGLNLHEKEKISHSKRWIKKKERTKNMVSFLVLLYCIVFNSNCILDPTELFSPCFLRRIFLFKKNRNSLVL